MPKIVKPLTNTEVNNAKPKEKPYRLNDGKGLYLLVNPNKSKLWRFNYSRPFNKKRNDLSLGKYPAVTLLQARALRDEYLSLLAQRIDPQLYRQKLENDALSSQENTFIKIAEKWKKKKAPEVKEQTMLKNWQRLENHLFPKLAYYPITEITPQLVIQTLEPLQARGVGDTLHRTARLLNEIMDFAVNCGILEFNKCINVGNSFTRQPITNNPTIRPEELPTFLSKLTYSNVSSMTKILIKWQLLTMVRPKEAVTVEWCEIDFYKKLWTIPAEKMKGGKKPHTVPLSTQALSQLEKMKEITGHQQFVFTSIINKIQPMSSQTANRSISLMGYKGHLTAHGLRALADTYLSEQLLNHEVIEACLSHGIKNSVRKAYNRSDYLEQRKPVMQLWGDFVENCSPRL
ncbi:MULTISPECIES: tyrosine-type recombinase/integrase [Pasteurellaceae]|uniref:Tyrosine-type recombinase/integrase n=1 Tax=Pasteurella atlantica TaxID=2827233 RepID=A0AAW8CQS5_9PAST|nr:integrase arm-type DNA-binding domain-containing protein [Pasteurella atlantica]MBR0573388.1 tyrosine-type recombinase/integrase [Pasteurella atlantica]MDP8039804.1 tyrosine-type recombinase/integrase [Pasteurella atlantica]MDP8041821.1 tyrosine-type recombinase/integrase [Pasteurella atlantica]MDP8043888.1 tyrosine-type recombinase/integrase [Pasteurella atlantica]MDP8046109.1 tyrosine-type recombinase/integrase [Pasteurella atlantica]